jgi:hypothetical protein
MANDLTKNPLMMDTAAVISLTNTFIIKKIILDPAGAAGSADFHDGNGRHWLHLACPANQHREVDFGEGGFTVTGLELAAITAGAHVHIFCG